MIITLDVLQKDLDLGCANDTKDCPVARAVNRVLREGLRAEVEEDTADISDEHGERFVVLWLPDEAVEFINAYDEQRDPGAVWPLRPLSPVQPFSFELDIPEKFLKYVA